MCRLERKTSLRLKNGLTNAIQCEKLTWDSRNTVHFGAQCVRLAGTEGGVQIWVLRVLTSVAVPYCDNVSNLRESSFMNQRLVGKPAAAGAFVLVAILF